MLKLRSVPKRYVADSHHSVSPTETVATATRSFRSAGLDVFDGFHRIGNCEGLEFPVFRPSSSANYAWGKGLSTEQSMASAVMELAERFSAGAATKTKVDQVRYCRREELDGRSLGWEELTPSNVQLFLIKDLPNADGKPLLWMRCHSLSHDSEAWLPASRVFLGYKQPLHPDFSCSNGLSASNTVEEAIVQGLSEVIERHASHVFSLNSGRDAPRLRLDGIRNHHLERALAHLHEQGYEVLANYHSDGMPLSTVSTLIYKPQSEIEFDKVDAHVHFATAADPEIALIRCVTESAQSMAIELLGKRFRKNEGRKLPPPVEAELTWRQRPGSVRSLSQLPSFAHEDFLEEIREAVRDLDSLGHETIVADLTHPKLGLPVVRVICAGLQPNFLPFDIPVNGFNACISKYIERQQEIHTAARGGQFFEQRVFDTRQPSNPA